MRLVEFLGLVLGMWVLGNLIPVCSVNILIVSWFTCPVFASSLPLLHLGRGRTCVMKFVLSVVLCLAFGWA